jgi:hypothetical protein
MELDNKKNLRHSFFNYRACQTGRARFRLSLGRVYNMHDLYVRSNHVITLLGNQIVARLLIGAAIKITGSKMWISQPPVLFSVSS